MTERRPPSRAEIEVARTEDRRRMRQNLAVFVIVLVLMVACGWFVDRLLKAKALAECLESGRRNCVPLEIPQPPRR